MDFKLRTLEIVIRDKLAFDTSGCYVVDFNLRGMNIIKWHTVPTTNLYTLKFKLHFYVIRLNGTLNFKVLGQTSAYPI